MNITGKDYQVLLSELLHSYSGRERIIDLLKRAGLNPADIDWNKPIRVICHEVLDMAAQQNTLKQLISVLSADYPRNKAFQKILESIQDIRIPDKESEWKSPYSQADKKVRIFFCYSQDDLSQVDELKKYLRILRQYDYIEIYDPSIDTIGENPQQVLWILNNSDIVLLCLSPSFFKNEQHLEWINQATEINKKIIAIEFAPTNWSYFPSLIRFDKIEFLHSDTDREFAGITKKIKEVADSFHKPKQKAKPPNREKENEEKLIIKDEEPATEEIAEAVPAGEEAPATGGETPPPAGPRFLQAKINEAAGNKEPVNELQTDSTYIAAVFIGYPNKSFVRDTSKDFPSDMVFTETKEKETIQLFFITNQEKNIQSADIQLPYTGDSNIAEFAFKTAGKTGQFEAEIYAFHKNRLIQKAILTATIKMKTDARQ